MKRVIVTGSSGYLGRKLVTELRSQGHVVLGVDLAPAAESPPDEFVKGDIRDSQLIESLRDFRPSAIVHCAFVIKQMRNSADMTDINVGGTKNIIRIADELKPDQFLFLSSATAFGAWPDNPVPIPDGMPVKGRWSYQYSGEKANLEADVQQLAERHPKMAVSWVRPSIVGGPQMDNFLGRFIFDLPVMVKLSGYDQPMQFVHEDDVIAAILTILNKRAEGAFNLGPTDHTKLSQIGQISNRRVISLPFWIAFSVAWICWKLRGWWQEYPPGILFFARYPWVVSPDRLINELGFEFSKSSMETITESYQAMQQRK